MGDESTTGSTIVGGIAGGLQKGLLSSQQSTTEFTDNVLVVYGTPADTVPVYIGSQIAFDIENNDVYIGVSVGTREWSRLGSLT